MLRNIKTRSPRGIKKVFEWQRVAVIAVIVVVAFLVVLLWYLSSQQSKATGDAQEVYYAGVQYMTQLATNAQQPAYLGNDPKTAYLADNRPVLGLVVKPVHGKFWLQTDCDKNVLNYVICRREVSLPFDMMLEFTGVFPQQSEQESKWRIYKPQPEPVGS